ncbi:hypothetical protein DFH06DRAFT_1351101 [Mycena polygramma]|nr:hypothetical protein DFH06DRAFT_1351101 [Mycena polygramma]
MRRIDMMGLWLAAELDLVRGNAKAARSTLLECLAKTRGSYPIIMGHCLTTLSDPRHGMDNTLETIRWAVIYLAFMKSNQDPVGMLHALLRLATLSTIINDDDTALNLFKVALEGGTAMDIHPIRGECMLGIGDIAFTRGDPLKANQMWTDARSLFVRSSQMKRVAAVDKRLKHLPHTEEDSEDSHHRTIEDQGAGSRTPMFATTTFEKRETNRKIQLGGNDVSLTLSVDSENMNVT